MQRYRVELVDRLGRSVSFIEVSAVSEYSAAQHGRRCFGLLPKLRIQVRLLAPSPSVQPRMRESAIVRAA